MFDQQLARAIVRRASDTTKTESVKIWLREDARGSFESTALELIGKVRENGHDPESERAQAEIADHVKFLALTATLNFSKRQPRA